MIQLINRISGGPLQNGIQRLKTLSLTRQTLSKKAGKIYHGRGRLTTSCQIE